MWICLHISDILLILLQQNITVSILFSPSITKYAPYFVKWVVQTRTFCLHARHSCKGKLLGRYIPIHLFCPIAQTARIAGKILHLWQYAIPDTFEDFGQLKTDSMYYQQKQQQLWKEKSKTSQPWKEYFVLTMPQKYPGNSQYRFLVNKNLRQNTSLPFSKTRLLA